MIMKVSERIERLREAMRKSEIDLYIIPSADYHQSEYVGDYFKFRQYMSGFTGSAGTLAVTMDRAGLWTDGRYFIQAEKQLEGSGIELFRMGEPEVGTIEAFIEKELPRDGVLGFDGRTVGNEEGSLYKKSARIKNGSVVFQYDLSEQVWRERPPFPFGKVFSLDLKYTGESTPSKLARVRGKMKEYGADLHILSSLDDIAWFLNIRGDDVAFCPLVLAYAVVLEDSVQLFSDRAKFPDEVLRRFEAERIHIRPYEEIWEYIAAVREASVLLDPERISYALYHGLSESCRIIEAENPEILMKCIKNETEIQNIKEAHRKDAVAHTRFMYWLKNKIGKLPISEISASRKLEELRREQEGFLGPSFEPISAAGEHGAIVHYSATEESDTELKEGRLFLTDTGGHYLEGSTDITRTVALGEVSLQEKEDFTLVARAMLRLADTVFLHGCSGVSLDCIAREVFWKEKRNFNHGTGHGVGYLLNIHEPPINFRWREGKKPSQVFEENMVITDEPGLYIAGSHGIRLENELLVQKDEKNEYGQFMRFEILTFVPIDLDALLPEKMTEEERGLLNDYHRSVYEKVSPYLPQEEREWLKKYTRPV